ncbi:amidohydrolase family protein [Brevibacillus brevis]|uniref:amidohydrolase family protein n=1 Tax=Brevibacillus brevis TaxID=1393 RepID=UPI001F34F112|nr:amidohydrolase family protein [Brevibacillus brevis]UIO45213.1 amidohydrolase family protein [Brevibacillus brevis]
MNILDARVRLPQQFREARIGEMRNEYVAQYDAVLQVRSTMSKTLDDLMQEMKESGVDHAIMHAEYEFGEDGDALNEALAKVISAHTELFSGFGTISMEHFRPMRAVQQVSRIRELGFLGVNIQPAFFEMPIDDRKLYPVYAKAAELGLAVAIHTGINYSRIHPIRNEHPLLLDQVACDFPELTLIACHGGWPWVPEMVAVARKHPNVLMDLGGLSPRYLGVQGAGWEMMYRLANNLLQDQILFATDWPVFPLKRAIAEWKELSIKPEVLEKVLGSNARALFSKIKAEVKKNDNT